jgi:hypothetical protein
MQYNHIPDIRNSARKNISLFILRADYRHLSSVDAGWSSPVARQAHNLKAAGSNPAPATKYLKHINNLPKNRRKRRLPLPTEKKHNNTECSKNNQ